MAKKPTAKSTPAPAETPAAPVKSTTPPKRLVATATRTPAGRVSKSSPAARDATPPKAAPLTAPTATTNPASVVAPPKAGAGAKPTAKLAKAKPTAATVKPAVKPIKLTSSRKPKAEKTPRVITHDEVAIRAYLIAEKRHAHGIHAEPHEDWAEAERQLQAELA